MAEGGSRAYRPARAVNRDTEGGGRGGKGAVVAPAAETTRLARRVCSPMTRDTCQGREGRVRSAESEPAPNDDAADSAGLVADQRRHRRPHKHRAARLEDGGDDPRGELRAAADGVVGA